MRSFVDVGFQPGFALSKRGDRHTCPTCGRVYVLRTFWELELMPPAPLIISEDDGTIH
jgi:hypothetical protein